MAGATVTMLVTVLVMMVARTGAMCPAQCSCEARTVRCHGEIIHIIQVSLAVSFTINLDQIFLGNTNLNKVPMTHKEAFPLLRNSYKLQPKQSSAHQ